MPSSLSSRPTWLPLSPHSKVSPSHLLRGTLPGVIAYTRPPTPALIYTTTLLRFFKAQSRWLILLNWHMLGWKLFCKYTHSHSAFECGYKEWRQLGCVPPVCAPQNMDKQWLSVFFSKKDKEILSLVMFMANDRIWAFRQKLVSPPWPYSFPVLGRIFWWD